MRPEKHMYELKLKNFIPYFGLKEYNDRTNPLNVEGCIVGMGPHTHKRRVALVLYNILTQGAIIISTSFGIVTGLKALENLVK